MFFSNKLVINGYKITRGQPCLAHSHLFTLTSDLCLTIQEGTKLTNWSTNWEKQVRNVRTCVPVCHSKNSCFYDKCWWNLGLRVRINLKKRLDNYSWRLTKELSLEYKFDGEKPHSLYQWISDTYMNRQFVQISLHTDLLRSFHSHFFSFFKTWKGAVIFFI